MDPLAVGQPEKRFLNKQSFSMNKKTILSILLLGILFASIPFGVKLVKQRQELRSKASFDSELAINFGGERVTCAERADSQGVRCSTTESTVEVTLQSPFGLYGTPIPTGSTTPVADPTAAPTGAEATQTPAPTDGGPTPTSTTPVETATPAPTVTPTPAPSWSENLLNSNMVNATVDSTNVLRSDLQNTTVDIGSQKVQTFGGNDAKGIFKLVGTATNGGILQVDEYAECNGPGGSCSTRRFIKTDPAGTSFEPDPSTQTFYVILRSTTTSAATFSNVAFYKGAQKSQQFSGNDAQGTFTLDGTMSGSEAYIQVDEYAECNGPGGSCSTRRFIKTDRLGVFTSDPSAQTFYVILRSYDGRATFSNVSLKKQI